MSRVEVAYDTLAKCKCEAEAQFIVRTLLREAGIPLGSWGTFTVERGTLTFFDEPSLGTKIFEWNDRVKEPK
jgi:hypothetical protein